ncbi:MAG TPA: parvulin peptidyl-prolyl isomerase, partial [Bacteroidetes bacterium]|nr:parvulin peptidyl-prolyl isomerase [Bacteroidota bacterium]
KNRMLVDKLQQEKFQKIRISRSEVEQFYNTMKDSLPKRGTSVNLSHLLLMVKPGKDAKEEAYKKISEIEKELKAGADFAALAKKYSQDPGSAAKGGDLGYVTRGDLVKPFEEAAFKLKPGQMSGIVETKYGYHIIKMIDRKGDKIRVRHILIRVIPTQQDELKVVKEIKVLYRRAKAGANFAELAKKYSDDKTTRDKGGELGWFELSQLKIKEFRNIADTLKIGEVSEPFKTRFGYHIMKLNDKREGGKWNLQKDWEQLEQMALARKRNAEFKKWVQGLKKDVYINIKMAE